MEQGISADIFLDKLNDHWRTRVLHYMHDLEDVQDILDCSPFPRAQLAFKQWKVLPEPLRLPSNKYVEATIEIKTDFSSRATVRPDDLQNCSSNYENLSQNNDATSEAEPKNRFAIPSNQNNDSTSEAEPKTRFAIPSNLPDEMNILILGETGTGKSSFINNLANVMRHNSIDDAVRDGVQVLIECQFLVSDGLNPSQNIIIPRSDASGDENEYRNERLETSSSRTKEPLEYSFKYMSEGRAKVINMIDTPGMADSEGHEQDAAHLANILSFIAQYDELHAICFFLKPDENRLSVMFKYCFNQLLRQLHSSACQNILFCCTHTRANKFKADETRKTLKQLFADIQENDEIKINVDHSTMFMFDSEAFEHMCVRSKGGILSSSKRQSGQDSWNQSETEINRWLDRISQLPAHKARDTLSLNNARIAIMSMAQPISKICRTIPQNKTIWENKLIEIQELIRLGKDLTGRLEVETIVLHMVEKEKPHTVCTDHKCLKYYRLEPGGAVMNPVSTMVCHQNCKLLGIIMATVKNPALKKCVALRDNINSCKVCGCGWEKHMHVRYDIEERKMMMKDVNVETKIHETLTRQMQEEAALKTIKQLEASKAKLDSMVVDFTVHLNTNSLIPLSDTYANYLNKLIAEEEEKSERNDILLEQMRKNKSEYDIALKLSQTQNVDGTTQRVKTAEEIDQLLGELYEMEEFKELLRDINRLEREAAQSTRRHLARVTDILNRIIIVRPSRSSTHRRYPVMMGPKF